MPRSWDALVRAGRKAAEAESASRWTLGDLALEAAPMGDTSANTGSTKTLREFAKEIGVELDALRSYRDVAAKWSPPTRIGGASWSVHRELMGHPQRRRMLKPGMTVDSLRIKRGKQPTRFNPPPRTPKEKAKEVRDHLADPDVRRAVEDDPEASKAVRTTDAGIHARRREESDAHMRKVMPKGMEAQEFLTAVGRLYSAKHGAGKSLAEFRDMNLTDNQRATVLAAVEEIENVLGWVRSFVENGTRSFDNELELLLQEEG